MPFKDKKAEREWRKEYNKTHPRSKEEAKIRTAKLTRQGYFRKLYYRRREEIFDKLGHECARCGFSDWRALHIDHVNGGGNQERKILTTTYRRYKAVMDDTDNKYQILCANCNFIKKHEELIEKYGEI